VFVDMPLKRCSKCWQSKPFAAFHKSAQLSDGYMGFCKECRKNPPRLPDGMTRCLTCGEVKPITEMLASTRKRQGFTRRCISCHRQKNAVSIQRHLEDRRQRNRDWNAANADYYRRYAEEHPELKRAARIKWERNNPDMRRASFQKRRARKAAAPGSYTAAEWRSLCAMYGNRCLACGSDGSLTADHVVPLSRGGRGDIGNIQPLCQPCNSRKHAKSIDYRKAAAEALAAQDREYA
jgi:5-methylcytosine-specific restriction endonuclease McrA